MTAALFEFPTLTTPRLLLRELTSADADRLFEIHSNADAMRWFGNDPMPDRQHAVKFIAGLSADRSPSGHLRWALTDKAEPDVLLGSCGLFSWTPHNHSCKVGYELHPEAQGQGLMTEALREVLEWGFEVRELNRIVANIHADNAPSRTLAERLGFVEEGLQRQDGYWGGRYHDLLLYSLLRDDYS